MKTRSILIGVSLSCFTAQVVAQPSTQFLLSPKSLEVGIGVNYGNGGKTNALRATSHRNIAIPLSIKIGISKNLELTAALPLKHRANTIITSDGAFSQSTSGKGDYTLGINYQVLEGHIYFPDTSASIRFGFPSADDQNPIESPTIQTGSAYRSTSIAFAMIKAVDPAVLFASANYRYIHRAIFGDTSIQPGTSFTLAAGAGFSLNDAITLTGQLNNEYSTDTHFNGVRIPGTGSEGMSLSLGVDYRLNHKNRLEFSSDINLDSSENSTSFGVQYIRSFF